MDLHIFVKDVMSKNPAGKIAQGHSPVFYPDGLGILFSKEGQIYETGLDINSVPKALKIPGDKCKDLKFSPNGSEFLFVGQVENHSRIGIYNLASKKVRWCNSQSYDNFPFWSPDGKQVTFIKTETLNNDGLSNFSEGKKFSICTADAETLTAKVVWQSPGDDGGFAQETYKPLTWTSSNRILFFSEHTGWNHIFSMNPDGTDLKDITPGDGEVENFIVDASGQNIYFDGNRGDLERRHIWKSNIKIGTPVAVTSGEGIETNPQLSGETLFCFKSTFNAATSLARVDEYRKITLPLSVTKLATFSSQYFVKPEKVTFQSSDGTTLYAQLYIDRKITGKRGAIVYIHGGPYRQMLSGFHPMEYYNFSYAFNQYLASMGYAVLSVNYRGSIGYGKKIRTTDSKTEVEGQYRDVLAGVKFLQILPEVDKTKIAMWGGSYGGYFVTLGLERNPEIFKAGVDLHCAVDWTFDRQDPTKAWSMTKTGQEFFNNKSASTLPKWTSPILFVHGNDSTTTEYKLAVELEKKLNEIKAPVEVSDIKDDIHFGLKYEHWVKIFTATKDFFDRKLK
jgi:dipeptidyl aminopeptidase/acylaminoacyl peptidase